MALEGDIKPVPIADAESAAFWAAAADGRLVIQRCGHCGNLSHPPVLVCHACRTVPPTFAFAPVSGRGTIGSWTVMRQAFLPGFAADVPFVLARVVLAEAPDVSLIGRLVDGPDADVEIGAGVEVVFDPRSVGPPVPAFRLVGETR